MKLNTIYNFLISPFFLKNQIIHLLKKFHQKLEQLIIDIESEIDIEKRFDFSRSNSKEKQLS